MIFRVDLLRMLGALLLSIQLRDRAHTVTDAALIRRPLILAIFDGSGDRLAPDRWIRAAGAGDGHGHASAADKRGGPQAGRHLDQGAGAERRDCEPAMVPINQSPVIGRLVELPPWPLQMPNASLKLLLQHVVEVEPPAVFCVHLL